VVVRVLNDCGVGDVMRRAKGQQLHFNMLVDSKNFSNAPASFRSILVKLYTKGGRGCAVLNSVHTRKSGNRFRSPL